MSVKRKFLHLDCVCVCFLFSFTFLTVQDNVRALLVNYMFNNNAQKRQPYQFSYFDQDYELVCVFVK